MLPTLSPRAPAQPLLQHRSQHPSLLPHLRLHLPPQVLINNKHAPTLQDNFQAI